MSSTNKTANYELSQFVGTDIPSILSDYNGDMRKIDAGIAEVATSAGSSASAVSALAGRVTTAENSITSLNGALEVTNQRSIQNQTAITGVQGVIPSDASTENLLATSDEVSDVADDVKGIDTRVTALEEAGTGGVKVIWTNETVMNFVDILKYLATNVFPTLSVAEKYACVIHYPQAAKHLKFNGIATSQSSNMTEWSCIRETAASTGLSFDVASCDISANSVTNQYNKVVTIADNGNVSASSYSDWCNSLTNIPVGGVYVSIG